MSHQLMKMEKVEDMMEGSSGKTGQPQDSGGSLVALSIKAGQVRPTGHLERESEVQEAHANNLHVDRKTLRRWKAGLPWV